MLIAEKHNRWCIFPYKMHLVVNCHVVALDAVKVKF